MGTNLASGQTAKDMIQAKLTELVQKFFEVDTVTALGPLASIVMSIVAECSASAAPVIGHIKDGVSAIGDRINVGVGYYHKSTISRCSYAIELALPPRRLRRWRLCLKTRLSILPSVPVFLPLPL